MYLSNAVALSVQRQAVADYDRKMQREELAAAIGMQQSFERKKGLVNGCLSEVSTAIDRHTQWSPILRALVENMPDSVILTELEVKHESIKQKVASKDDPGKTVDVSIPVRRLQMKLSTNTDSGRDREVQDFRDRLRSFDVLRPNLEDIVVDRKDDKLDGRNVVSYEITIKFKPGF